MSSARPSSGRVRTGSGTHHPNVPDPVLRALEDEFPGWHVWRSSAGRLWAVRTGPGPHPEPLTVDADDQRMLRAELGALPAGTD